MTQWRALTSHWLRLVGRTMIEKLRTSSCNGIGRAVAEGHGRLACHSRRMDFCHIHMLA
jgi:hypothetical protein